jgi:hypothetical protein
MFAIIAAIIFALALLFDLLKTSLGEITNTELLFAGLMFFALHFATGWGWRGRGGR